VECSQYRVAYWHFSKKKVKGNETLCYLSIQEKATYTKFQLPSSNAGKSPENCKQNNRWNETWIFFKISNGTFKSIFMNYWTDHIVVGYFLIENRNTQLLNLLITVIAFLNYIQNKNEATLWTKIRNRHGD
jgi:hypothetical protein